MRKLFLSTVFCLLFALTACASEQAAIPTPTTSPPAQTLMVINRDAYIKNITYSQLMNNEENYKGKAIVIKGKVIKVSESSTDLILLYVAFNGNYDNQVLVRYNPKTAGARAIVNDNITIYCTFNKLYKYQATNGSYYTEPFVDVEQLDINN